MNVILNRVPRSYGPSVNQAAKASSAEFLVVMNSDAELVEDSISILIYRMNEHGLAVGMPESWDNCKHYGMEKSDELMTSAWRYGALFVIRRKVFVEAGMFDERYRFFHEDSALWKTIEKMGYKIAGWRGTWVKHKGGASAPDNVHTLFAESKELYEKEWPAA